MSRQIQLRRGTQDEHEKFTGAPGEVTVDTTNNTIRVHDGQTVGGTPMARADSVTDMTGTDYVVAWQAPTPENNYTWYRKYRSGWIEQGGKNSVQTVTLPIEMANTNYHIQLTGTCLESKKNVVVFGFRNVTTTGFITQGNVLNNQSETAASNNTSKHWYVCGFAK